MFCDYDFINISLVSTPSVKALRCSNDKYDREAYESVHQCSF